MTESIGGGNFFGEEEMLSMGTRVQNCRCVAISTLLILIPLEKFQKLLHYTELKDALTAASQDRQKSRQITIQAALGL